MEQIISQSIGIIPKGHNYNDKLAGTMTILDGLKTDDDIKSLSIEDLEEIILLTFNKPEGIQAQVKIAKRLLFKQPIYKLTIIDKVYKEYYSRRVEDAAVEFTQLGIPYSKIQKLALLEVVNVYGDDKAKIIYSILGSYINNNKEITFKIRSLPEEFDVDLEGVRVELIGNNVKIFVYDKENIELIKKLFDKPFTDGFAFSSKFLKGFYGELNINFIFEDTTNSSHDTKVHEMWHSIDFIRSTILGDIYSYSNKNLFGHLYGLSKQEILSPSSQDYINHENYVNDKKVIEILNNLNSSVPGFFESLNIPSLLSMEFNYDDIQFELPAFIAGFLNGNLTISNKSTNIISQYLVTYISPFNKLYKLYKEQGILLIEDYGLSNEDYRKLSLSINLFEVLMNRKVREWIKSFNHLSEFYGDPIQALVELSLIPLKRWKSYVRLKAGKSKI